MSNLGFDISTEKVEAVEGQYQPKTGEITSLSYDQVDKAYKIGYDYTLDRENSTENNLVYKGTYYDEMYDETDYSDGNTIAVNKEEKSLAIYDADVDSYSKFTLNNDGLLVAFEKNSAGETSYLVTVGNNKNIYGPLGNEIYANIKIKLAE